MRPARSPTGPTTSTGRSTSTPTDGPRCTRSALATACAAGARFRCPRGIGRELNPRTGRSSTGMPWEGGGGKGVRSRGDAFFDPAFTLARRLRFAAPFSTEYLYNPYLGVGSFGAREAVADA